MATRPTISSTTTNANRPKISAVGTQPALNATNQTTQQFSGDLGYGGGGGGGGSLVAKTNPTIGGTIGNFSRLIAKGFLKTAENIVDLPLGIYGSLANDKGIQSYVKRNLTNETEQSLFGNFTATKGQKNIQNLEAKSATKESGIGGQIAQGIGQVGGMIGTAGLIPAKGIPFKAGKVTGSIPVSPIITGAGGGIETALQEGKTGLGAVGYATGKGLIEGGTEAITGGIKIPGNKGALDDIVTKAIGAKFAGNKPVKAVAKLLYNTLGEGAEEVLAGLGDIGLRKISNMKQVDQDLLASFIVGGALGGILGVGNLNVNDVINQEIDNIKQGNPTSKPINEIQSKVKQQYGTTNDYNKAGFILNDTSLLNLDDGKGSTIDHSEVANMNELIKDGAIRIGIKPDTGVLETQVKPSTEQSYKIAEYANEVAKQNKDFTIELIDGENRTSFTYKNENINTDKIRNDINNFYDKGITPSSIRQPGERPVIASSKQLETDTIAEERITPKENVVQGNDVLVADIKPETKQITQKTQSTQNKTIEQSVESGMFDKETVKKVRSNPELVENDIAIRTTKSGNKRPAIRDSGIFAPKQFENFKFKDLKSLVGGASENFLSAAGAFDNITSQQAAKTGWGPMKNLQFEEDQLIAERNTFVIDQASSIIEMAKKHKVKINKNTGEQLFNALEGKQTTPSIDALAKDIRENLNGLREQANIMRKQLGKDEIGFIENYAPHVQKVGLWNQLVGDKRTTISDNFDFIVPNEKTNPFAKKRVNAEFNKETNMWKLLDSYISAISNDIYTTPIIEKIKAVDSVLMEDYPNMSNFLKRHIRGNLLSKSNKIDDAIVGQVGSTRRAIVQKGIQARSIGALGGNIVWSLTTQPASLANTVAKTGLLKTIGGAFDYATNKSIRNKVNQLPSMVIKTKGSSIGKSGAGDVDRTSRQLNKTKLDSFNNFTAILSDNMEQFLTGLSAAAGYRQASKFGLTGKEADMFADMTAQNTQSMYNKEARPVLMNSLTAKLGAPFQTFSFEMYRYAKQLAGKGGGIPLEMRDRLAQIIRLFLAMAFVKVVAKKATGKDLNSVGTFIPLVGGLVDQGVNKVAQTAGVAPREYSSTGRSPVAPLEDFKSIYEAIDSAVRYGNIQPVRKELVKWGLGIGGVSGASTVNRFIDGMIANSQGFQTTRSGRVAFPVEGTEEQIKALFFGPYGTREGKKYIESGFKSLGENQSATIKSSNNISRDFNAITKTREYNSLIRQYEELQAEGKSTAKIEREIDKLFE